MVATRGAGKPSPGKLSFKDKITGKGLSTDVILKKLKTLQAELAAFDQDHVDKNTLNAVRKELVNTSLLLHKDRGVKAYTACCLADLLRLYAPAAPYTTDELRDIFQFFFRQLSSGLTGMDAAYYGQYFHLLESLSTVKSVVLICDLPNGDELMTELFKTLFALVRRDIAKKIELFMTDILVAVIEESNSLPPDCLDIILGQFMDKNARMEFASYRMVVSVCNVSSDKLQRPICQYFTDIIVEHAKEEEYDQLRKAHELVKQINHDCPSLLHNVIPQLEEELRVEDVQLRSLTTQVLGEMYSDKGGGDLVKKYPTTWSTWLARRNDKTPIIRQRFVESCRGLLISLPEQREVMEDALRNKFMDPDEKIRAAACKVYSHLDYETALHHVSETQLRTLGERALDKKHAVRHEALNALGRIYNLAYPEIESGDAVAIQQFSWIPHQILLAAVNAETRGIVEQVVFEEILPLPVLPASSSSKGIEIDEVAWTDRLLNTMRYLDEKTTNSLIGISGLKLSRPTLYETFVSCCVQNNGGVIDENEELVKKRLSAVIQRIASQFPEPQKAAEDLHTFAKLNENRLYKLLNTCMDTQSDLKSAVKATNEFFKRVEQSSPSVLPTVTIFLRKATLRLVNQSCIPTLIKRLERAGGKRAGNQAEKIAENARLLMTKISKHRPSLYKMHIAQLSKAIADDKDARLLETALQALASVLKWDPNLAPTDRRMTDKVSTYALESNSRHSKFAARILAFAKDRDNLCNKLVESISSSLPTAEPEELVAHLAALSEIARLAPDSFEHRSDVIMEFMLKSLLLVAYLPPPDQMEDDEEWFDDADVPPLVQARILALKICRKRCIAHSSSATALDVTQPVLRLFTSILANYGSATDDVEDDPKVRSRMRLQAAVSLLHLSTIDAYAGAIATNFVVLAITIQDECFNVRIAFLNKLLALLTPRKLHGRFNVIPFLTIHDPEPETKQAAVAYIRYALRSLPPSVKVDHFELLFVRLLHTLAHHPDFALEEAELTDIAQYIEFYLDCVANGDNCSLLYHLAMRLKTVRDAQSEEYSERLYALSELAQELIKLRATAHNWAIPTYPGRVKLPGDILRPLPDGDLKQKNMETTYLPDAAMTWVAESARAAQAAKRERKPAESRAAKRKAESTQKSGARRGRPPKRRRSDEADEDDDDPDGSDDGESEGEEGPATSAMSDEDVDEKKSSPNGNGRERHARNARSKAEARLRDHVRKSHKGKTKAR